MPQDSDSPPAGMALDNDIGRLLAIMARLRDPADGCAWDVAQSFATIAPYTIEEAHEVADAIARNDMPDLCDELGDLLLQVVFHARIAEEAGAFGFTDVVAAICAKMTRRHPHIFEPGGETPGWEAIKALERAASATSDAGALSGVALALPALMRARKLQERAARVGFDWPDTRGVKAKIVEEIDELEAAETADDREDEMGDLLFALVNFARHIGVDAEAALRRANRKFEDRFAGMERLAGAEGQSFAALSLGAQEAYWQRVKRGDAP